MTMQNNLFSLKEFINCSRLRNHTDNVTETPTEISIVIKS
jgi:hypothetical protein